MPFCRQAYAALPESVRLRLFQRAAGIDPGLMELVKTMAGLGKGGIRGRTLAQRPQPWRAQLDEALLKELPGPGEDKPLLLHVFLGLCYAGKRPRALWERLDGLALSASAAPADHADAVASPANRESGRGPGKQHDENGGPGDRAAEEPSAGSDAGDTNGEQIGALRQAVLERVRGHDEGELFAATVAEVFGGLDSPAIKPEAPAADGTASVTDAGVVEDCDSPGTAWAAGVANLRKEIEQQADLLAQASDDLRLGRIPDAKQTGAALEAGIGLCGHLQQAMGEAAKSLGRLAPAGWSSAAELDVIVADLAAGLDAAAANDGTRANGKVLHALAELMGELRFDRLPEVFREPIQRQRDAAAADLRNRTADGRAPGLPWPQDQGPDAIGEADSVGDLARGWLERSLALAPEQTGEMVSALREAGLAELGQLLQLTSAMAKGAVVLPEPAEPAEPVESTEPQPLAEPEEPEEPSRQAEPPVGLDARLAAVPGEHAGVLARSALDDWRTEWQQARGLPLVGLVYCLLKVGRPGLAGQLAAAAREDPAFACHDLLPPPELLEALSAAAAADFRRAPMWPSLQPRFEACASRCLEQAHMPHWNTTIRLLIAAAALPVAARSPQSTADSLLVDLPLQEQPALHRLVQNVCEFAQHRLDVPWTGAGHSRGRPAWLEKMEEFRQDARDRYPGLTSRTFNFQRASEVWNHWMRPEGAVFRLVDPVRNWHPDDDGGAAARVKDALLAADFGRQVKEAQRQLKQRSAIVGSAIQSLERAFESEVQQAASWLELANSEPRGADGFRTRTVEQLREGIAASAPDALRELDELAKSQDSPASVVTAATCAAAAVARLQDWLNRPDGLDRGAGSLAHAVAECLLEFPELHLDAEWQLEPAERPLIEILLTGLAGARGEPDANAAFSSHRDSGDHLATRRLIDRAKRLATVRAGETLTQCASDWEKQRDQAIAARRAELEQWADRTRKELETAVPRGLVSPASHQKMSDELSRITRSLKDKDQVAPPRFDRLHIRLQQLSDGLGAASGHLSDAARERLEQLGKGLESADIARVRELIEDGDLLLAHDFLDKLAFGEPLPAQGMAEHGQNFLEFFVHEAATRRGGREGGETIAQRLFATLNQSREERNALAAIRDGGNFAGVNYRHLPAAQARQHAEALTAWFSVKSAKQIGQHNLPAIEAVLNFLGFTSTKVKLHRRSERGWLHVDTDEVVTPPIAAYGSEARGRYRILCDFGFAGGRALRVALEDNNMQHGADLVFYFGRLSERYRQEIAREFRRHPTTALVIDDLVMLRLAAVRDRRLDMLLELATPFCHVVPYTSQGGKLLPEMFRGRRAEVIAIESMAANSCCLVYGGRQIGKSVLLRHVERRVNTRPGSVARFIDLKEAGLGVARPPEELWAEMVQQLRQVEPGIFPQSSRPRISDRWFEQQVREWLDADPGRRILVLLDEADAFLAADGKPPAAAGSGPGPEPFTICTRIRSLMDSTGRRFKAVFAGLHNVQRSTKAANNPLGQLGVPRCVGPLIHGGEAREAQALIEAPLAHVGIYFESVDLVVRILAQANYYPNLIQIYCQQLVEFVHDRQTRQEGQPVVPYHVTAADIEDIYERRQLREALRERFDMTLSLDPRFRLIAYLLAFLEEHDPRPATAHLVRKEALQWWPRGFQEGASESRPIAIEDFETLLDEMIGLGILRVEESDHSRSYHLRSPNVAALLGNPVHIEQVLEEAAGWEPPAPFHPDTFRAPIETATGSFPSPLTARQGGRLKEPANEVFLVTGSAALGLGHLPGAIAKLNNLAPPHMPPVDGSVSGPDEFDAWLESVMHARLGMEPGKTFVVVTEESPWDDQWMATASRRLKRLSQPQFPVAVVFATGPSRLWRLVCRDDRHHPADVVLPLRSWNNETVAYWLNHHDVNLGVNSPDTRAAIETATGLWPALIQDLATQERPAGDGRGPIVIEEWGSARLHRLRSNQCLEAAGLFGLDVVEPTSLLEKLWEFPEVDADTLDLVQAEYRDAGHEAARLAQALQWAELLGVVRQAGDIHLFDPYLRQIFAPVPAPW